MELNSSARASANSQRKPRSREARARLDAIFTELREVESAASRRAERRAERRVQAENLRTQAERYDEECARRASAPCKPRLLPAARPIVTASAQRRLPRSRRRCSTRAVALKMPSGKPRSRKKSSRTRSPFTAIAPREVTGAQSRLHTIEELENSLEGHVPGTRAIVDAWQRAELRGIEGIVSNLITTDERYARAMDVAFGARLSNVVTRTSEDAERAIEFLNRKESGRATFLPLDTLANREGRHLSDELRLAAGVIGYAHTLVETQPQYRGIVNFLVGNVLIVDQLSTGIALVRERGLRDTVVTLTGEQITGGGAITGGRFQRERSISRAASKPRRCARPSSICAANYARAKAPCMPHTSAPKRRSKAATVTGKRFCRSNCGSRGRTRRRRRWRAKKSA